MPYRVSRWLSLPVSTVVFAFNVQAGPVLDRIHSTQTITIGYRANTAPMSYEDKGRVIGYAVDVCQRIASAFQQQLKLPKLAVRYVPVTAAERIAALQEGRIDLECAGTTNTKARREQAGFGLTYFYAGASVLVHDGEGSGGDQPREGAAAHQNRTLGFMIRLGSMAARTADMVAISSGVL